MGGEAAFQNREVYLLMTMQDACDKHPMLVRCIVEAGTIAARTHFGQLGKPTLAQVLSEKEFKSVLGKKVSDLRSGMKSSICNIVGVAKDDDGELYSTRWPDDYISARQDDSYAWAAKDWDSRLAMGLEGLPATMQDCRGTPGTPGLVPFMLRPNWIAAVEKLKAAALAEAAAEAAPPPGAAGENQQVEVEGIQQGDDGVAVANGAQAFGLVTLNVAGLQAQAAAERQAKKDKAAANRAAANAVRGAKKAAKVAAIEAKKKDKPAAKKAPGRKRGRNGKSANDEEGEEEEEEAAGAPGTSRQGRKRKLTAKAREAANRRGGDDSSSEEGGNSELSDEDD